MTNRIYMIFAKSTRISYGQIVDQMGHMGFLDNPARFEPELGDHNRGDTHWSALELHYRADGAPITVEQIDDADELRTVIAELREKLDDESSSSLHASILQRLSAASHGLIFELPEELPDDVWEMLDATEGYFAEICDGLIFAHEGVFDSNLALALRWRKPGI